MISVDYSYLMLRDDFMLRVDFILGDDALRLYHSRLSIDLLLDLLLDQLLDQWLPASYKLSFEGAYEFKTKADIVLCRRHCVYGNRQRFPSALCYPTA